eukprot:COSAG02_NODE_8708_length_2466_cov_1.917195_2_plen_64_part_00
MPHGAFTANVLLCVPRRIVYRPDIVADRVGEHIGWTSAMARFLASYMPVYPSRLCIRGNGSKR